MHYVRSAVGRSKVRLNHVESAKNRADLGTKGLIAEDFIGAPGPFYLRNHFSWIIGLDRDSSRPVTPSLVPGLTVR